MAESLIKIPCVPASYVIDSRASAGPRESGYKLAHASLPGTSDKLRRQHERVAQMYLMRSGSFLASSE